MKPSGYVDGSWTESASDGVIQVVDPGTEEVVENVARANAADTDRAVAAADRAFGSWSATSREQRAYALRALYRELSSLGEQIAEAVQLELGAPAKLARNLHAGLPLQVLQGVIDVLDAPEEEEWIDNSLIVHEAIGVVAAITPWNYPLHQSIAKVAAALAAGCTVVHKPAALSPLDALVLAEAIEAAGIPNGVYNLVIGPGATLGEQLAAHPDVAMVSFTGSTEVGKQISRVAADNVKRVSLELGGKSASVILDDVSADELRTAVKVTMANAFLNTGQTCSAWTRLVVPRSRAAEVESAIVEFAPRHVAGETMGPLVSAGQRDQVLEFVSQARAEGSRPIIDPATQPLPDRGYHVRPTVLGDVDPSSRIAQEEVFGPVLVVLGYDDEDHAAAIVNDNRYGLAGGVWGASTESAVLFARRMRTGQVDINGGRFNPRAPFGGYRESGNGRELGGYGVHEFCEIKSIQH